MIVRMTNPSTSNCAASGVRSSSARAERVIAHSVCRQVSMLSSYKRYSDSLPNRAPVPMLLEAMTGKRLILHAAGSDLCSGLRALALLLLP